MNQNYTDKELKEIDKIKKFEKSKSIFLIAVFLMFISTGLQALGVFAIGSIPLPVNIAMCLAVLGMFIFQNIQIAKLKRKYKL